MLPSEFVEQEFMSFLRLNRVIHLNHAYQYIYLMFTIAHHSDQYADNATRRLINVLNEKGLWPDQYGYYHAPRTILDLREKNAVDEGITKELLSPRDALSIYFQIYLRAVSGRPKGEPIIVKAFNPSIYEDFAYISGGEVYSVCALDMEGDVFENRVIDAILASSKAKFIQDLRVSKTIENALEGVHSIFLLSGQRAKERLRLLAEVRGKDILRQGTYFVLDEQAIQNPSGIPMFYPIKFSDVTITSS